ncbi:MAG: FHA domain-containing protein [Planctomycetota bacterium]
MNEQDLQDVALGRKSRHWLLAFAASLESDPEAVAMASSVVDDAFVSKLKKHLRSAPSTQAPSNLASTMNDQEPRRTMIEPDDVPRNTMIESEDDIRKVQEELRKQAAQRKKTAAGERSPGKSPAGPSNEEKPYRPTQRLPVIALVACDDGKETGELFRIRGEQFVIGRTEGDFQITHDEMVSSRHVVITRQTVEGKPRVAVTDLQSRNGLFVRASKAPLDHGSEFLIGNGHYRMEINQTMEAVTMDAGSPMDAPMTRQLDGHELPGSVMLSEIVRGRVETRIRLDQSEYRIGRDRACDVRRTHDAFVASEHAKLSRSTDGKWFIESRATLNGIWIRIPQIIVANGKSCEFRIGEQRFRLKLGVSR